MIPRTMSAVRTIAAAVALVVLSGLVSDLAAEPQKSSAEMLVIVFLKLADDPVAVVRSRHALSSGDEKALVRRLREKQERLVPLIEAQGAKVLSTMQYAMNGIKVQTLASRVKALSRLPGVVAVKPVTTNRPTSSPRSNQTP